MQQNQEPCRNRSLQKFQVQEFSPEKLSATLSTIYGKFNGRPSLRALVCRERELVKSIERAQSRIKYMSKKKVLDLRDHCTYERPPALDVGVMTPNSHRAHRTRIYHTLDMSRLLKSSPARPQPVIKSRIQVAPVKLQTLRFQFGAPKRKSPQLMETKKQVGSLPQIQCQNSKQQKWTAKPTRRSRQEGIQLRKLGALYSNRHRVMEVKNGKSLVQQQQIYEFQQRISELHQKEEVLLERLAVSEKFKDKCQSEFREAKDKYDTISMQKQLNSALFQDISSELFA